jgi:hypothetical protein
VCRASIAPHAVQPAHGASPEPPTSALLLHKNASLQPPGLLSSNSEGSGAHVARNPRESEGLNGRARPHRWNDTSLDGQRDTENAYQKAGIRPWADGASASDLRRLSLVQKKKKADISKAPGGGAEESHRGPAPAPAPVSRDATGPRTATLDRIRSAMGAGGIHKAAFARSMTPPPVRQRSPQQSSVSPHRSLTPMRASLNKAKAARLGVVMSASLGSHTSMQGPQETAHTHRSLRLTHFPCCTCHVSKHM